MAEYIKRAEAVKSVLRMRRPENSVAQNRMLSINQMDMLKLPTADVAPVVHGRWEQCFEDWRKQIEGDKCSICGFEHYGASIAHYHFCPNCGAKMGGEAEELPHE